MTDQDDERAAMTSAWQAFFPSPEIGVPVTFEAGWEARATYELERTSQEVAAAIHEVEQSTQRWKTLTSGRQSAEREVERLTWVIQTATGHLEALQGVTALNLLRAALAAPTPALGEAAGHE